MSTSRASKLLEKYKLSFHCKGWFGEHYTEVFTNPTVKEMRSAVDQSLRAGLTVQEKDGVRFFADNKTKTVYAWGSCLCSHLDTASAVKVGDVDSNPHLLQGFAQEERGKFVMRSSDLVHSKISNGWRKWLNEFFTIDWSWVDRYIQVSKWIEYAKEDYDAHTKEGS